MHGKCVSAFLIRNSNFLQHHAIHYKQIIRCRENRNIVQIINESIYFERITPAWSALLFNSTRFAAFHYEIEPFDSYDRRDCKRAKKSCLFSSKKKNEVDVGPSPALYSFFRQEFAKNTPRLWLDCSGKSDDRLRVELEDVLYSDWRLVDECIRWLHLPLSLCQGISVKSAENDFKQSDRQPPPLTGCERILHIGSERSKLNMAQIVDMFVRKLVNVRKLDRLCCNKNFTNFIPKRVQNFHNL